jgi:hypothetical protein
MGYSMMGVEIYDNTITGGSYMCRTVDLRGGRCLVYNNNLVNTTSYGAQIREEYDVSGNPPTHATDGQPQFISDTYYFGNRRNGDTRIDLEVGSTIDYEDRYDGAGVVPTHNQDFWQEGASFDGTSGVGIGLLAARPATCTTGVGYWATDTNTLYRAASTNTWETYYTPYTYPHPLTDGPRFTVAIEPTSASVERGTGKAFTVSATGTGGFTDDITLSVEGMPDGWTGVFVPEEIAPGETSELTITADGDTAGGTYPLTLKGTATI